MNITDTYRLWIIVGISFIFCGCSSCASNTNDFDALPLFIPSIIAFVIATAVFKNIFAGIFMFIFIGIATACLIFGGGILVG